MKLGFADSAQGIFAAAGLSVFLFPGLCLVPPFHLSCAHGVIVDLQDRRSVATMDVLIYLGALDIAKIYQCWSLKPRI